MQYNLDQFGKQLKRIGNELNRNGYQVPKRVNRVLFEGVNDIRNTVITSMKHTLRKSESIKATKSGKRHFPSKPGYPPAIMTGELAGSYNFDVGNMRAEVGSKKKYAPWLEKGTKKMEARPVLEPSVEAHKDDIKRKLGLIVPDIILDAVKK